MNLYYLLLQAQEIVSNSEAAQALTQGADAAAATADAAQKTPNNGWMTWVMLIGLFVIMWLFMIRPQALALNTENDRIVFNNVGMYSYQDTWITTSKSNYRHYVKNSFIEGAVDFIYNSVLAIVSFDNLRSFCPNMKGIC